MNKLMILGFTVAAFVATETVFGHGGRYRGPGDVVPPGGPVVLGHNQIPGIADDGELEIGVP